MSERVDTVVVGAGQAGLATSFFLTELGREHVVLERGQIGETWRSERWDGFFLNTPNWTLRLPGHDYRGDDPDAFSPLRDVIAYVEGYARSFAAPVREGVTVHRLHAEPGGYALDTTEGTLAAENVVLATGAFQRPTPPAPGAGTTAVFQLHTSAYRNPAELPDGGVLIVGSGQSGCQIADELLAAGRTVYLAVGGCPWFPRRYRGKDILHWVSVLGILDETVDSLPAPRARMVCNPPVSGNDGGHDCHPGWLAVERGAQLVGRVARIEGSIVSFAPGLGESLASGNAFVQELTGAIDAFVSSEGLDAPASDLYLPAPRVEERAELDLEGAGITSILWASGFRPDYSWVDVPLADGDGWAVQERGITRHPGLYVVGLNWLHKRKSALFMGVGEDAEHVARHLAARA